MLKPFIYQAFITLHLTSLAIYYIDRLLGINSLASLFIRMPNGADHFKCLHYFENKSKNERHVKNVSYSFWTKENNGTWLTT